MPKSLGKIYTHVDNGGYTFEVFDNCIVVSDSYYNYAENTMKFNEGVNPENLEKIGMMFIRSAESLRKEIEGKEN